MSEHDPARIGAALQRTRESRGLTVTEAARASGVPASTVDTLERGEPGRLAGQPRLLAHLRVYARSLGMDPEALLAELTAAGHATGAADDGVAAEAGGGQSAGGGARGGREVRGDGGAHRGSAVAGTRRRSGRRRRPAPMISVAVGAVALLGLVSVGTAAVLSGDEDEVGLVDPVVTAPTSTPTPTSTPAPSSSPAVDPNDDGGDTQLPGRAPEDTRVQLLDGVHGGGEAVEQAEAALDELGYDVVATGAMAESWDTSGVYYTNGWQAEAESLRERDGRFVEVAPHPGFTADVDLHVIVGRDWPESSDGAS